MFCVSTNETICIFLSPRSDPSGFQADEVQALSQRDPRGQQGREGGQLEGELDQAGHNSQQSGRGIL